MGADSGKDDEVSISRIGYVDGAFFVGLYPAVFGLKGVIHLFVSAPLEEVDNPQNDVFLGAFLQGGQYCESEKRYCRNRADETADQE